MESQRKSFWKSRLDDLMEIGLSTGIVGIFDYIGGDGLNHPFGDLAMGAGIVGAGSTMTSKYSKLSTSIAALGASLYPQMAEMLSGEVNQAVQGAFTKVVVYGAGLAVGTIFEALITRDYTALVDVKVTYPRQEEAEHFHKFLTKLITMGDILPTLKGWGFLKAYATAIP